MRISRDFGSGGQYIWRRSVKVIYTSLVGSPTAFSETTWPGPRPDAAIAVFSRYAHGICVHKPICRECGRICIGLFFVFYTGYSSGNGNTETREAGPFVYLAFLCFFQWQYRLKWPYIRILAHIILTQSVIFSKFGPFRVSVRPFLTV